MAATSGISVIAGAGHVATSPLPQMVITAWRVRGLPPSQVQPAGLDVIAVDDDVSCLGHERGLGPGDLG
jgi:hypothetical protein